LGAPTNDRIGDNGGAGWEPERDRKRAIDGTTTEPFFGNTYTDNVVTLGLALDMDDGTLDIYVNGTLEGELISGLSGYYTFAVGDTVSTQQPSYKLNFGQRPFAYTPPTGFKSLCTQNLDDPLIADPSTVFDIDTYTGNGSTQERSEFSFEPDLVWIKSRDAAHTHVLTDSVRGTSSQLFSNLSDSQGSRTDQVTAFNSDGFSLGANAGGTGGVNIDTTTYVAWAWDSGTTTASNTDGSITSSVLANTSAGFSIVSYTGNGAASATIGHGLNAAPEMIMVKNRDVSDYGVVYHVGMDTTSPQNYFLKLFAATSDSDDQRSDAGAMWNDTAPTSSVFSVGTEDNVNASASTEDYIAYCWTSVEGYSKFGSYTGDTSSTSKYPFIYTGFRPKWLLVRCSSVAQNWIIIDAERNAYNIVDNGLYADLANQEQTSNRVDFTSNGFKIRINSGELNTSSETHVYAAFAEHPFKYARAR
jgi:hypothetical protein